MAQISASGTCINLAHSDDSQIGLSPRVQTMKVQPRTDANVPRSVEIARTPKDDSDKAVARANEALPYTSPKFHADPM